MISLGKADEAWPVLRHSVDPRLRSDVINWLHPRNVDPNQLAAELDRIDALPGDDIATTQAPGQQLMDAILFHRETSQRRALILALGTFERDIFPAGASAVLIDTLLNLYSDDPDSGIHGAVEWTLRTWGQQQQLDRRDAELMKLKDWGQRRWYRNGQGQTFALIEGPVEFRMGSAPAETEHPPGMEPSKRVKIPRRFAIAAKEVTNDQFRRFLKRGGLTMRRHEIDAEFLHRYSPDPSGPCIDIDWYWAAQYCNWLSEQEGLPKEEWCYIPNSAGVYTEGMTIPADVLDRTGYRLPTEAEWEYACRAGAETSRYYGHSVELLGAYARYQVNSNDHAWPCGNRFPNDLGLFDMLGNQYEWCHDSRGHTRPRSRGVVSDVILTVEHVHEKNARLLRGGTFLNQPANLRSAYFNWGTPAIKIMNDGFRPARTLR